MHVVWSDFRVGAVPCFLYAARVGKTSLPQCYNPIAHHKNVYDYTTPATGLGIIELYSSGKPDANFFVGTAAQLGLAYYATTISLNVITTGVICTRLFHFSRAATFNLASGGPIVTDSKVAQYTGTLPMVVESALPYSLAGVAFLVSYGMQSNISILFGALYGMWTVSVKVNVLASIVRLIQLR